MRVVSSRVFYEIALVLLFCLWLPSVVLVAGDNDAVDERVGEAGRVEGDALEEARNEKEGAAAAEEEEEQVRCMPY